MNKKLISFLIAMMILPNISFAIARQATLVNLEGTKKIVTVGSSESNFYTGKLGYRLQTNLVGAVINQTPALFETSLATAIGKTDTSMTLVSGKTRDGLSISGNYCFTIDSGLNTAEYVCGVASSTSITSMTRGIGSDGVTSYASLKYTHRYGADVKITDFPVLQQFGRILNGQDSTPGGLTFGTNAITGLVDPSSSATSSAANIGYVNSVSIAGAPNASQSVKGISYLSSNPASSTFPIALNSEEVATTSGANKVVRADSNGDIDPNYINQTSNYNWSGTNSFATTTVSKLSVTGTSTFSVSPIIIAQGSFTKSSSASVATTTITHNLGVVPYLIKFFYTGGDSSSFSSFGVSEYNIGTSTLIASVFNAQIFLTSINTNSLVVRHQTTGPAYCDGSLISSNVSTTTASITWTACNYGGLGIGVNWIAYGIRAN